jgi:predicted transposase/invertase (TIGR01784 family)
VIHTVQLKNQKHQVFYDKLTFIYITLPNFTKTLDELTSLQDKWFFVFRHLPELDKIPAALQESIFEKLFHITELIAFKPQEREAYQASLKYYRDLKNVIDTAYDDGVSDGFEKGIEQGIEQGRAEERAAAYQERLQTAKNLKQLGLSNEQIAQASGLPLSAIAQL